jgi:hypothetical protein
VAGGVVVLVLVLVLVLVVVAVVVVVVVVVGRGSARACAHVHSTTRPRLLGPVSGAAVGNSDAVLSSHCDRQWWGICCKTAHPGKAPPLP